MIRRRRRRLRRSGCFSRHWAAGVKSPLRPTRKSPATDCCARRHRMADRRRDAAPGYTVRPRPARDARRRSGGGNFPMSLEAKTGPCLSGGRRPGLARTGYVAGAAIDRPRRCARLRLSVQSRLAALDAAGVGNHLRGKTSVAHTLTQDEINALLVERARAGPAGGAAQGRGPYVFGRGGEEAQALASAGVRFEVVPGVTSAIAAPSYAGIPVTHRDFASTVTFVTGHEDPTEAGFGDRLGAPRAVARDESFSDGRRTIRRSRSGSSAEGADPPRRWPWCAGGRRRGRRVSRERWRRWPAWRRSRISGPGDYRGG